MKNLSSFSLNVSTLLEATASAGIEFQLFTHHTANDPFSHIFSAPGNRKLIDMTSGTGIYAVLKYIRKSNINFTVKSLLYFNQVNPQHASFNGIQTNFFEAGYII